MNTYRRCSGASSATTRSPPERSPERLSDGASSGTLPGHHLNIDPESTPQPDRLQRDGIRPATGRCGPIFRTLPTPEETRPTSGSTDPHRQRRGCRGQATYTDPQTPQTSRVVIHASSVVRPQVAWNWASPSVGHRWARRRRRTATTRQPRQRGHDEPRDPWYGPAWPEVMNEFAKWTGDSPHRMRQHCPACSPPSSRGSVVRSTKSSRASIGTADWVFVVDVAPAASRSANGQSTFCIRSPTSSTVVISRSRGDVDPHARGARAADFFSPVSRSHRIAVRTRGLHRR